MPKIIIISDYWNEKNIKDGVMQRVFAVDGLLEGFERVYIQASYRAVFKISSIRKNAETEIISLNPVLHLRFLINMLRQGDKIYIHNLHNLLRILPALVWVRKGFIFDVHGLFPEEIKMLGNRVQAALYSRVERYAFKHAETAIFVTGTMKDVYLAKYPFYHWKSIVYFIGPTSVSEPVLETELLRIKTELHHSTEFLWVVYSGNLQAWQNIDLMCEVIKALPQARFRVLILSMETDEFRTRLAAEIESGFVQVMSVHPASLKYYYTLSQFGFVLRDDVPVNNVANPTKLVEYLLYGIIPVVKSPEIGDFNSLGYKYVPYEDLSGTVFNAADSKVNVSIITEMLQKNRSIDFKKDVLGFDIHSTINT